MKYLLFNILFILFLAFALYGQDIFEKTLPAWEEGYLDIHHINTGRGNSTFLVLPDGTTMLIDAGDNNRVDERAVPAKPDPTITAAECIAKYVKHFMPVKHGKYIDYCLVTHFHSDHLGAVFERKAPNENYYLTGITEVYQLLPIMKIVDRGYQYLCPGATSGTFFNYKRFIDYISLNDRSKVEAFDVGSFRQFSLIYSPDEYRTLFSIQNIYANGNLWIGNEKKSLFPELETLSRDYLPRENMLSCVVKMTYGNFAYYTGGDIPGFPGIGMPAWHNVESAVAREVGHVEVAVLNHHGYEDTTNETFVSLLSPQVFIAQTWNAAHLNHAVLNRILSKRLYPYNRDVFVTNVHPAARVVTGNLIHKLKSLQGHIVLRVEKGGKRYWLYVLDDSKLGDYKLLSKNGPYECICNE